MKTFLQKVYRFCEAIVDRDNTITPVYHKEVIKTHEDETKLTDAIRKLYQGRKSISFINSEGKKLTITFSKP